jgi:phytoene dehydrogenase-like protein
VSDRADAVVVGAGFGGLGAALALAERGARVVVCEQLRYPGGCASTFTKGGAEFDAGATLVSGFGPEQLFGRWIARHRIDLPLDWIDPLVELRAPGLRLPIGRDRDAFVARLADLPGAPREGLRAFFAEQRAIADVLWEVLGDVDALPPFDLTALLRHARRSPRFVPLLRLVARPLTVVLARHGVASFAPLRTYVDALCQITVQCSADEAESTFALAAMDYYHRGTAHVQGGVGALAHALARTIAANGGELRYSTAVRGLHRDGADWIVETRRGPIRTRRVFANVTPTALGSLIGEGVLPPSIARLGRAVDGAWGAVMRYALVRPEPGFPHGAHHVELVDDPHAPFVDGNHVFVSVSGADEARAPGELRTVTASTHVALGSLVRDPARVRAIQDRMRSTMDRLAPDLGRPTLEYPASPRTFARFTGRPHGAVGGVPRRAGLSAYAELGPREVLRDLWLVGDSVFPGQSALATATGGVRAVAASMR